MSPGETKLTVEEQRLLWTLRDIPPSRLRDSFLALVDDIATLVREPHCVEMQADGVPCESAYVACDRCRRVVSVLERLRAELGR
jgi:hypothetical protein